MTAPLRHFRLFRVPDRTPENPKIGVRDPGNGTFGGSGGGVENGVENGRKWHFSGGPDDPLVGNFCRRGVENGRKWHFFGFSGVFSGYPRVNTLFWGGLTPVFGVFGVFGAISPLRQGVSRSPEILKFGVQKMGQKSVPAGMECQIRKLTKVGTSKLSHPGSGIVNHGVEVDEVDNYKYIYIKGIPTSKLEVRNSGVTFQGLIIGGGSILIGNLIRIWGLPAFPWKCLCLP